MNQETAQPPLQLDRTTRNFTVLLSPTPRGARLARRLTTEQLRSWGLPLDPDRAEHIVGELAANAITHGRVPGRDFRLTLYVIGGTLRIEVTDARGDRPVPRPQQPTLTAESGRGLAIVEALADRWGVTQGPPPRKTVWAEIGLATTDTRSFPSR
ncbi:ATP-binding protein [Streptomyces aurantiacus]|uniref:ATP-binding protein n=1 Tax=Streptomyces aurantiacus TaxID=47760 RepID=A0A7G1P4Y5_9ACTN|nr:ATP-binding protein [Streptomyces aurantiacus]BCL30062.1 ATP-binding protein [Streptomyces aurantiacus]